jgi:hypothetical protein
MTDIQKKRTNDLFELGMVFNGTSYVGRGENSDFNAHYIEFMYDNEEEWGEKITKLRAEKRSRELNKILEDKK